jgi:hypothetical protein
MKMNGNYIKLIRKLIFLFNSNKKILFRQIDRNKKSITRFDQQRNRDAEVLRTVTDNLQRAFYTNDSISTDMTRETEKLKKEEDGMRVKFVFN